ncbi:MAG: hypothetical protein WBP81_17755, partial [Solirubrobacteraceae bacterium]
PSPNSRSASRSLRMICSTCDGAASCESSLAHYRGPGKLSNGSDRTQGVRPGLRAPPEPPNLADSPVRRIVGRRVPGPPPGEHDAPAPNSLRELAFLDRINEIGAADQLGAARLPRLYDEATQSSRCSTAPAWCRGR